MPTESWQYVGVDWDSGGWIAVGYPESGEPEADWFESIAEFWEEYGSDAERTVVDVPIDISSPHRGGVRCTGPGQNLPRVD